MILKHTFSPPDNDRMANLCGPMDTHLRTIEAALQVKVAHRFEQFRIEGPKARAEQAMTLIQALYEIAQRSIPPETVQLMLSGDMNMADDSQAPSVHTRRGWRRYFLRLLSAWRHGHIDFIAYAVAVHQHLWGIFL